MQPDPDNIYYHCFQRRSLTEDYFPCLCTLRFKHSRHSLCPRLRGFRRNLSFSRLTQLLTHDRDWWEATIELYPSWLQCSISDSAINCLSHVAIPLFFPPIGNQPFLCIFYIYLEFPVTFIIICVLYSMLHDFQ